MVILKSKPRPNESDSIWYGKFNSYAFTPPPYHNTNFLLYISIYCILLSLKDVLLFNFAQLEIC